MLGVLITLLFCIGMTGWGRVLLFRGNVALDPAAAWGVSGLLGLGGAGLVTLAIGFVPGGLSGWGLYVMGVFALIGCAVLFGEIERPFIKKPEGAEMLAPLVVAIGALFALFSVLAPSDIMDWDTLAYHLAVPKLWIEAGKIGYIPFIHHSNFPFTVDLLYVWGLRWGGESGAKAFQLAYLLIGAVLVFGLARQRYGTRAGWWATVAFVTVPVVLWEAGSAYIDVAHGLYAGGGILLAALAVADPERRRLLVPAGLLLGFAAGTKYTGLQTIAAVGLVLVVAGLVRKQVGEGFKQAVVVGGLAMLVAAPWFVKNVVNTGNPVYPFFYERLGGHDWDQRRADIYRNEQQTFGVGRNGDKRDPTALGHAVLGLAYQPGRFINPAPTEGLGTPLGSIGLAVLAGLLLWPLAGRIGRFEGVALGAVVVSLGMWFLLSQQSRYIVPLAVPLAVLVGGATTLRGFAGVAMGAVGLQAVYSLWLIQSQLVMPKVQVVTGQVPVEAYRKATNPFFEPSQAINQVVKGGKVALYDEVFGFLLDVPYFWANPGHCTVIPYDSMQTAEDYMSGMRKLGFTHVYISVSPVVKEREMRDRWLASMGMGDPSLAFTPEKRAELLGNWEAKYHILIADAVKEGKLVPEQTFRSSILFRIAN
jgi:hypothetical protein